MIVRRSGLVEQVIDHLSHHLTTGVWTAGQRLPSVADLAVELDVGRSTVREAVQALAHRGVLDVQQGRGTFVTDRAGGSLAGPTELWLARAELVDLYEARRGLEVEAARLAAVRRDDDDVAALGSAAEARRAARAAGAVTEWAAADLALHRAVFTATHNPVLARLFDTLADAMTDAFTRQSADPASEVDTADEHDRLVAAIVAGDPVAATAATSAYLEACQHDLQRLLTPAR